MANTVLIEETQAGLVLSSRTPGARQSEKIELSDAAHAKQIIAVLTNFIKKSEPEN